MPSITENTSSAAEQIAKPPQIIHPDDMIRMSVGENEEIHSDDLFAHALQPELGSSINLHMESIHLDMDAGANALIAWIGRSADRAVAGDHRHALRGA